MWSWIFPKRCPVCKIFIKDEDDLCLSCEQNWPRLKSACCTLCLFPFKNNDEPHLCGDCLTYESAFEEVKALGLYMGDLKNLILKFKFQKEESLALFFAKLFSQFQNQYDLIIPVPLHFKKLRQRGYNQSALIAKNLSKQWQIDWDPFLLKKVKETCPQSELKGDERRENLKGSFRVQNQEKILEKRVLLIDDVYTTGTTVREAAKQILKKGAKSVSVFVIARAS